MSHLSTELPIPEEVIPGAVELMMMTLAGAPYYTAVPEEIVVKLARAAFASLESRA